MSSGGPPKDYKQTLLGELADCVDCWREISSELGARPYRTYLVKTRWTGSRRGEGIEKVIDEHEIWPSPKVDPVSSIQQQLQDIGLDEVGTLQISEISPSYTEDRLMGRSEKGKSIAQNESFYWELCFQRDNPLERTKRRRFMVTGVPSYEAGRLQWTVRLVRAGTDRDANGSPG